MIGPVVDSKKNSGFARLGRFRAGASPEGQTTVAVSADPALPGLVALPKPRWRAFVLRPWQWAVLAAVFGYVTLIWYVYVHDYGFVKEEQTEAYMVAMTVSTTKVRDNVFMLTGEGGNVTVLVGDEGLLLIDTDEKWMAPKIAAAVRAISDKPVRYVINTHSHGDHRGGNAWFRKQGAEIIAHRNARDAMIKDGYAETEPEDIPTVVFSDSMEMVFAGEAIRIVHFPYGHTHGDAVVYFETSDVVITGDVFVAGGLPYISKGSGASLRRNTEVQGKLITQVGPDTAIIPGHGPVSHKADLIATRKALARINTYVGWLKYLGVSRRMLPAFHPLAPWPMAWHERGIRGTQWVRLVYSAMDTAK